MTKQFIILCACVIIAGCASTTPPKIYMPASNSETRAYYRNGIPIGATQNENVILMTALEPTEVAHKQYMRLWFLYKNNSDSAYLLEPLKVVKLTIVGEKKTFNDLTPESPTAILARVENEKATNMIMQAIGGTLEALSTEPTTVTDPNGGTYTVNDKKEKIKAVVNNTTASMVGTELLYNTFKSSINSGILRRNTLFAHESVNGFVYFLLPQIKTASNSILTINPEKYKFVFTVATQSGDKIIEFSPTEGE